MDNLLKKIVGPNVARLRTTSKAIKVESSNLFRTQMSPQCTLDTSLGTTICNICPSEFQFYFGLILYYSSLLEWECLFCSIIPL